LSSPNFYSLVNLTWNDPSENVSMQHWGGYVDLVNGPDKQYLPQW